MTFEEIKKELEQNAKSSQNPYYTKVVPNAKPCIGVKVPVLRSLAKKIAKGDYKAFLREFPEEYLEHQALKAFVLGYAKDDIETILDYATSFVPSIQDWMVNDAFCQTFSIARKYPERVWEWLMQYVDAGKCEDDSQLFDPAGEYPQRVVAVTLMSHYLNDGYYERVLEVLPKLIHPAYYTKMGVAWAVATAYAKYPAATKVLLDEHMLDPWTHNKSIQKMIESFRVSDDDKVMLRGLKLKA
ncbi:MAG: DNA alkylation repair protein [Lachnospiraceae bacterium]|nr:DNA alkylation repair protein [Lachnospiraceae bacterium]